MTQKITSFSKNNLKRHNTRIISIGNIKIGGGYPIRVQSMTNTDTRNIKATVDQINTLAKAGCEIVRLAVVDNEAATYLKRIKEQVAVPLVADIHYDYKLALKAIDSGIDGLRINPGNIGSAQKVNKVVDAAQASQVPIRIGVNSGSIEKSILSKFGGPTPEAMVESALKHLAILEKRGFTLTKVSLKSSSVLDTVQAYQLLSQKTNCPLHIGITEAGTLIRGSVKSSIGIGILLYTGLGDTLRVSLTGDPLEEVLVAWEILRNLELRQRGPEIISCPTCGRTEINLLDITQEVEKYLQTITEVFTVAVMGCSVNGPGEAREADIGLAGGKGFGLIFRKGQVIKKVPEKDLIVEFKKELDSLVTEIKTKH